MPSDYRFSFGPWNISEGADPFGPPVRPTRTFADKLPVYKKLGFVSVEDTSGKSHYERTNLHLELEL